MQFFSILRRATLLLLTLSFFYSEGCLMMCHLKIVITVLDLCHFFSSEPLREMHSIEFSHARSQTDSCEHFLGMINAITLSKISEIFLQILINSFYLFTYFTNKSFSLFFIFRKCVTLSSVINITF